MTISASEMGRRGAAATNKILTTEGRRKAAKKGWARKKKMEKWHADKWKIKQT